MIELKTTMDIANNALGRIVTKLDPVFAESSHDSERIKESERLGEQVIKRLEGEHRARQNATGKL